MPSIGLASAPQRNPVSIVNADKLKTMMTLQLEESRSEGRSLRRPESDMAPVVERASEVVASITDVVSPVPTDTWRKTYESDAYAMPTQAPDWADAIVQTGSYRDDSRMYEFSDGQRIVLPLFTKGLGPALFRSSPPPAWGFGGVLAESPLREQHISAVLEDLSRDRAVRTQIRPNPLQAALWKRAAPAAWSAIPRNAHILDLSGGFAEVWSRRFKSGARNYVRRAQRKGVEIECGSGQHLVSDFHKLLTLSFDRWARRQNEPLALARWRGLKRDPEDKFRKIVGLAGEKCRFWVARLQGEPIAAILVLQDRCAHYTRGAMDEELAGDSYANYLLHSRAIEAACESGCDYYHMGETGESASLSQFKSRFGAVPTSYAEYRFERLPVARLDQGARRLIKRVIGFRDA